MTWVWYSSHWARKKLKNTDVLNQKYMFVPPSCSADALVMTVKTVLMASQPWSKSYAW